MRPERASRKLTAILSAHVKGYICLMAEDELAIIRKLEEYREVTTGLIKKHPDRS